MLGAENPKWKLKLHEKQEHSPLSFQFLSFALQKISKNSPSLKKKKEKKIPATADHPFFSPCDSAQWFWLQYYEQKAKKKCSCFIFQLPKDSRIAISASGVASAVLLPLRKRMVQFNCLHMFEWQKNIREYVHIELLK